ncbi:MAG: hypothetical protein ACLGIK_07375, partial [Gemmatimonadota bacterium]
MKLRERVQRWWTRAIIPSVPSLLFTVLLFAMMGASLLAGRQLTRSRESHRRATDEALTEYATFAARLFGDRPPAPSYTADGAARGKATVAEGLGLTLLPDFSVAD